MATNHPPIPWRNHPIWRQAVISRTPQGEWAVDISAYGPVTRWTLRHVWLVPGPFGRLMAWALGPFGLFLGVVAVLVNRPGSSTTAEDQFFFIFVTIWFLSLAALGAVVAIIRTGMAQRRGTHRWEGDVRISR